MRKIFISVFTVFFITAVLIFGGCNGCNACSSCRKDVEKSGYDIYLELNGDEVKGSETVCFFNSTDNEINELKFNLFLNAFRKDALYSPISEQLSSLAYYNGKSYGYITVLGVYIDNEEAFFSITGNDENILSVPLKNGVFPEESVSVRIDFKAKLPNVIARTGINDKTVNLNNVFPILCAYDNGFYECNYYSIGDPFFSENSSFTVRLKAEKDYVVVSSGKTLKKETDGDYCIYTFFNGNVRDFSIILSKDFDEVTETVNGVEINYYFYNDAYPKKSLDTAVKAIKTFSEIFGEYGYGFYNVVQTEFLSGGMEYPCLSMISDDLTDVERQEVIVHETAHQWWYNMVGNNEIEHGFLDEGLTEYSVVLFFERNTEYGVGRVDFIKKALQKCLFC